jgi:hypothetical protein
MSNALVGVSSLGMFRYSEETGNRRQETGVEVI